MEYKSFRELVGERKHEFCEKLFMDVEYNRDGDVVREGLTLLLALDDSEVLTSDDVERIEAKNTPLEKKYRLLEFLCRRPNTDTIKIFEAFRISKQSELVDFLLETN